MTPFMPVVLWTDALVWPLDAAAIAFALFVHRHEPLSEPWRRVTHSASGMVGLVAL